MAATVLFALAPGCHPAQPSARHVLLVVVDTQRADHLSCYGYPRPTTPVLDGLAKEGVLFRRAASQSSWTLPSMISMFSGKHVAEEALQPPADGAWLPEVFEKAGFATAAFVSNDLLTAKAGFARGFDVFVQPLPEHGSNATILEWIRANSDRRTFTLVHLIEPHEPYDPPAELVRWTNESGAVGPARSRWYDEITKREALVEHDASVVAIERRIGAYDDEVRAADRRIGQILDAYKSAGLWAETAVLVAADHGEGLFTHVQLPIGTRRKAMDAGEPPTLLNTLLMTHGSHVDVELLHVPLILKAPGIRPANVEGWVENVDVLPTLLDLAAIPPCGGVQGQSLVPLARDPSDRGRLRACVVSYTRYNTSVIDQDSMQVILPSPRGECDFGLVPRVYDLAKDPECREDLAASRAELVSRAATCSSSVLESAIRESPALADPQGIRALQGMGYVGDVVDSVREDLARSTVEALLRRIADPGDCFLRLEAARALEGREIDAANRKKLAEIARQETSPALRTQIERLLAR